MSEVIAMLPADVIKILVHSKVVNKWVDLAILATFNVNIETLLLLEDNNVVIIKDFHSAPKVTLTIQGYNALK